MNEVILHYDMLIDEDNDPVRDSKAVKAYMDKWDGKSFIEALQLSRYKSVLEIGVGTGRLALSVCKNCKHFTGIDVSSKTIERAKSNLEEYKNIHLICADFLTYSFDRSFDIIYSSLTFMHIENKQDAIQKAWDLLIPGGRFVLSIDKNIQSEISYVTRSITVFPDNPHDIGKFLFDAGFITDMCFDTKFAIVFVAVK